MLNKVEICGVNTSNLPLLNKEQKEELLKKIKNGDIEARTEFINGNLRLVLSVIQRFYGRGENADDLFQIGCVGLIKAIDNFDLEQNVQFSTYAVPMIVGEVRRYLRDNNSIRVSRSVKDLAYKVIQCKEKYLKQTGKEPTIEQIAKELDSTPEDVAYSLDAIQSPVSLQEPVYSDGTENIYVMDQVKDDKNSDEKWAENLTIIQSMKKLNDKEKFYLYETPNQEIGWFTATLDKKQTGLAMNVELVLQPMGKIDNQPPYLIVQNDYKDKRNHNWIKIRLNGEIINGVKPIFNEAEMQKVKYWIELNKLPILLYWTQEETGYLEITKLIKPIDENTEELGEWTRKMLKPENLIGPFNSTEEMMKNLWDTED